MAKAFGQTVYGTMQQAELIESQGLHLVNNVMDLSKIERDTGYIAKDALEEIRTYTKWGLKK